MNQLRCCLLFCAVFAMAAHSAVAQMEGFQFFGPPSAPSPGSASGPTPSATGGEAVGESGGLDLGIFSRKPFTITASVRGGYNSNVNSSSTDEVGSWFNNYNIGINYSFGTPRLQLNAYLNGGLTYYYNTNALQQSQWYGGLGLGATYLATERLTLTLSTSTGYQSQPNIGLLGGATDQDNGDYFYTNTALAATYQWTQKFSTTTSVNFNSTIYLDKEAADEFNYYNFTFGQSFNWLVNPRLVALAEYRISPYFYQTRNMSSLNQFFLAGVDFRLNPRFTWNGRVGAQFNILENPVDGQSTYVGPYVESTLSYQFGPASNLAWVTRYGTEASGIVDVNQRQTFRTGLNINHSFNRRISANIGTYWLVNYYQQQGVIDPFYENIFSVNAGLNFAVNRFVSLSLGYQYTIDAAPERTGRNYNQHIGFGGVNFTF